MRPSRSIMLGAAAFLLASPAVAQEARPAPAAAPQAAPTPPDPSHVPFILPKDIPWEGKTEPCAKQPCWWGDQTYNAFGDPSKPGIYGLLVKWPAGRFSKPHLHDKVRYVVVLQGTWWVSSSNKPDMSTLYPFPKGTIARDIANTVHWDGAMAGGEDVIVQLIGEGPVSSTEVDEMGTPVAPPAAPAVEPDHKK